MITQALFWSQKLPFMVPMTNTNFVYKQQFVKIAFLGKTLAPYSKAKRQKIHISEMVHLKMISLAESRGSSRFLNT